ncbi:ATP-dependent DNA helicase [Methylobacterium nodulans]|uniref:Putative deoxyribonuclease n=1 Tax=Methylobacterium nodulans (strain LMG 21967 / CNCM I-2342 / ORS 2060) TaxID=460265 RepID=B8IA62_METNO|nr:ATP-dependent RecD-like DNA helicase [Methylobacterium nodulans]ACL59125.1 putative deoxyribonuclease [Methylobacterium nodulans ORS 2060]
MTAWSPQQDQALRAVKAWLKSPGRAPFYLGGYAGTGKTTLARHLAEGVKGDVLFAAFTGKAALVLRAKGCTGASTIHSLIYRPKPRRDGSVIFVLNEDSPVASAALVIVDECSMVGPELGRDLMSFGTKVLVLGDPAQLPPVDGAGYFTGGDPDFMLTEVHRQAADNPIIAMSMRVRQGGRLDAGAYGESRVIQRAALGQRAVLRADQILVGRNQTRRGLNAKVRQLYGRDPAGPEIGDRLVCLRNNKDKGLLNGGLWEVADVAQNDGATVELEVMPDHDPDAVPVPVEVRSEFFHGQEEALSPKQRRGFDEFTYGYALTVHKAQGSQWNRVVLFDESCAFRETAQRWLYTGLTRAADAVTVVLS